MFIDLQIHEIEKAEECHIEAVQDCEAGFTEQGRDDDGVVIDRHNAKVLRIATRRG